MASETNGMCPIRQTRQDAAPIELDWIGFELS